MALLDKTGTSPSKSIASEDTAFRSDSDTQSIASEPSASCAYVLFPDSESEQTAAQPIHGERASVVAITVNLVMAGLGVGILSLPWAMAGASVFPSMVIIFCVMALNVGTTMILVEAAERYQEFDLNGLLSRLPGRWGKVAPTICLVFTSVSVFLCLVSYIVAASDSLEPFVHSMLPVSYADLTHGGFSYWVVRGPLLALCAFAVLPLCYLDQRNLAFTSFFGILVNVLLLCVVLGVLSSRGIAPGRCLLGASVGTVTMVSTLMQCSILQMCVLPMYEELENRTPARFRRAVVVAFSILALLFAGFASAAYLTYGSEVNANIVKDLPRSLVGHVTRFGLAAAVLTVYPVLLTSVVAPIRHWELARSIDRDDGHSLGRHQYSHLATVGIVVASAVGAVFAGNLGTLNEFNGALQVVCFIAIAPGLSGLFLLGREGLLWRLAMYALLAVGLVMSALGLSLTSNGVEELTDACRWWT